MRIHSQSKRHFTITGTEKGVGCPKCQCAHTQPCSNLPPTTVHIQRVAALGHNVLGESNVITKS